MDTNNFYKKSILVNKDLHKRIKLFCKAKNIPIYELVEDVMGKYLDINEKNITKLLNKVKKYEKL